MTSIKVISLGKQFEISLVMFTNLANVAYFEASNIELTYQDYVPQILNVSASQKVNLANVKLETVNDMKQENL